MGAILTFQPRKTLYPEAFTVGTYLWLGAEDKSKGHPIRITSVDLDSRTFSYIGLDTAETDELSCQMSSRRLHPTTPEEISAYIGYQLMLLEPQRTYWQVIKDGLRQLRKQLLNHREEKQVHHAYRTRMKSFDLI
ncbi:MAG: hypothetical protein DI628_05570 [Blastochloris viridis]|uniref:Uncharacterized protein n=1 Tax=Blastochloris viridis TaxID=1079 RepID=A0A6N4R7N2_BLAVI|nr:MAG: hypothetical protein DI628_05570 [Blastochloris viridis]